MSSVRNKKGFTLVELLTVMAILALLVGIGIGLMGFAGRKMSEARTESLIKRICAALESYKIKYGYYIQQPVTGRGFYLDATTTTPNLNEFLDYEQLKAKDSKYDSVVTRYYVVDSFGQRLFYRCPGYYNKGSYDIGSIGSDGKYGDNAGTTDGYYTTAFGRGDDITNFVTK